MVWHTFLDKLWRECQVELISWKSVISKSIFGVKIVMAEIFMQLQAIISHSVAWYSISFRRSLWSTQSSLRSLFIVLNFRAETYTMQNKCKEVRMWCKKGILSMQLENFSFLGSQRFFDSVRSCDVVCRCSLIKVRLWILKTRQSKEQMVVTCGRWIKAWTSFV